VEKRGDGNRGEEAVPPSFPPHEHDADLRYRAKKGKKRKKERKKKKN